jgi:hypothetical protein
MPAGILGAGDLCFFTRRDEIEMQRGWGWRVLGPPRGPSLGKADVGTPIVKSVLAPCGAH